MSKYVALGFRVHVKPFETETEKKARSAGIVLAEHLDRKQERVAVDQGTVVAIGPDAWKDYGGVPWAAVGDTVVYVRHGGYFVGEGDDSVLVLNDGDIITKVEG